ncbi:MAG: peptidylprolyl isomerase [Bacteroidia bacterium]|nr:peptidylprolyl isomerase [Bacteroidia bacterium]NND51646.1 peptidylprolyl isomerase [Flavobacteriaceae bacterium]
MRYVLYSLILLLMSCEDKKSSTITTPKAVETSTEKETIQQTDTIKKEEREFPLLTEKNAMDFFLEYEKVNPENKVRLTTDYGEIDILLYPKTKFHRANFIFLTKQGYFDNTQFYRVINNFMIQAGNTDDPKVKRKRRKIGKYLLPKDTKRGYRHHRGTISMPSSDIDNPHKLASPYEFFIIQNPRGEYRLDGDYTIFGKVIRGMSVVDKIAAVETDNADWPLKNIYIQKVEIIK